MALDVELEKMSPAKADSLAAGWALQRYDKISTGGVWEATPGAACLPLPRGVPSKVLLPGKSFPRCTFELRRTTGLETLSVTWAQA